MYTCVHTHIHIYIYIYTLHSAPAKQVLKICPNLTCPVLA